MNAVRSLPQKLCLAACLFFALLAPALGQKILISPGHGYYNLNGNWTTQRGPWFGATEDFLTAEFGMLLRTKLQARGYTVYFARNSSKTAGNGVSGHPKWQECARAHMESAGFASSIWNFSTFDYYDQDIICRPTYANSLDVDLMISIHTNGGGGTGTETYYDSTSGSPAGSQDAANKIHTKVINSIRANYLATWTNRNVKNSSGAYGEIRRSDNPAILMEVAFHDKETPDNTALQNTNFREIVTTAMADGVDQYFGPRVPALQTLAPTGIGTDRATLNGQVMSNGGAPVTAYRFEWALVSGGWGGAGSGYSNTTSVSGNSFNYLLINLTPNTQYQFRAWAQNSEGWSDPATVNTVTFTTAALPPLPAKATNPNPANGATSRPVSLTCTWSNGGSATSYNVYFGTDSTPDASESQGNRATIGFTPPTLAYSTTYYWRIDAVNVTGVTTGDVWSFTTQASPTMTFANWSQQFGLAPGDHAGDPDHDRIANLIEYATGSNPNFASESSQPAWTAGVAGQGPEFTFVRFSDRADLTYEAQISTDLQNWETVARSIGGAVAVKIGTRVQTVTESGVGPYNVRVRLLPPAGGRELMRLKVIAN